MSKSVLKVILTFCIYVGIFMFCRIAFMAVNWHVYSAYGFTEWLNAVVHGFAMDCSVAGYLTVVPAVLISIESVSGTKKWMNTGLKIWFGISGAIISTIFVVDACLYGYWGFRLDTTPLFYFFTSPKSALASASVVEMILGPVMILFGAGLIYILLKFSIIKIKVDRSTRPIATGIVMLIVLGLLIIPIRGGIGLAPMNLSRAYFHHDNRLNHAAVNPAFSLLYSATHQQGDFREFQFMSDAEAQEALKSYFGSDVWEEAHNKKNSDVCEPLSNVENPDIWIIILESFSSHLLPSAGGEPIALGLDSIARSGLWFTDFYANSFRTDRALPSILSGFPALPTMSLLKYVDKIEHLPSISAIMKDSGYSANYYYGGNINFANIQAFLTSSGFDRIISESSFPTNLRAYKWGVADGDLFDFAIKDNNSEAPAFNVIQTSSSHEPFEVPYVNGKFAKNPAKNAFAYTDSCVAAFVNQLQHTHRWEKSIVLIVPDHLGAWPLNLPEAPQRHKVPLIITGGALNPALKGTRKNVLGSQSDIAATLLQGIGLNSDAFPMSSNLLDDNPHFAIFSEPEIVVLVTASDTLIYNIPQKNLSGSTNAHARRALKALLQYQYKEVEKL